MLRLQPKFKYKEFSQKYAICIIPALEILRLQSITTQSPTVYDHFAINPIVSSET